MAVNGKVVHFDTNRGFGFLAPAEGGDDVFLHINDVGIDESLLRPGAEVEFDVESTDRGAKALNVKVTKEAPEGESPAAERAQRREERGGRFGDRHDRGDRRDDRRGGRDDRGPRRSAPRGGRLFNEITELLLDASPDLTARQIVAIRSSVLDLASQRGWSD
ncbi:cold-shock protein [Gordonia neofelifaecis]|uniref:Cold-shock protein DNA-binding protein n=1 Tax=Gordonia neofelifaecis NRRL B-59395 TaxID=644548 RepID=F1YDX4_9ACTN|nr:cold shock domain-containing protein [Gordonia neofelifaecis]EGD57064.1 cold-shock protein DNA-binding protein [Gordonia neofelifaecis NRRL B-59395]